MVVRNFNVQRIFALPAEANPPLVIHADAVLAFPPIDGLAKRSKVMLRIPSIGFVGYGVRSLLCSTVAIIWLGFYGE